MIERRTSLMVAHDILQEARGGSNKTRLVYRCNLNFKIIKTWLSRLIERGLIDYSPSSRTWTTTSKGMSFILTMVYVKAIWDSGAPPEVISMIEMVIAG